MPSGDSTSSALSVDANGDVVGYRSPTSLNSQTSHGLLYTPSGGAQDLGFCPNWTAGLPTGGSVSVSGTEFTGVAVSSTTGDLLISGTASYSYSDTSPGGTDYPPMAAPFLLDYNPTTHAENWTVIPSQFIGSTCTWNATGQGATGVNASGQVVGGAWVGDSSQSSLQGVMPFVYSGGVQTNLGTLAGLSPNGETSPTASAIDSAGDVAFRATTTTSGTTTMNAILYVAATNTIVNFGANTGGINMGIYRSGNLIYVTGNSFSPTQQAVWTYNTSTGSLTMNGLGVVDRCFGINGSLTAVGSDDVCYDATSPGATPTPLYPMVANLDGNWQSFTWLQGINDAGQIAGWGTNSAGNSEGFLATPALPGDANLDGKVDINDLTIVLAHYNQTGMTWTTGDFTGDGTVDINDLTIVLAHYNTRPSVRPPEPRPPCPSLRRRSYCSVGAVGLLACLWRRRKA